MLIVPLFGLLQSLTFSSFLERWPSSGAPMPICSGCDPAVPRCPWTCGVPAPAGVGVPTILLLAESSFTFTIKLMHSTFSQGCL